MKKSLIPKTKNKNRPKKLTKSNLENKSSISYPTLNTLLAIRTEEAGYQAFYLK